LIRPRPNSALFTPRCVFDDSFPFLLDTACAGEVSVRNFFVFSLLPPPLEPRSNFLPTRYSFPPSYSFRLLCNDPVSRCSFRFPFDRAHAPTVGNLNNPSLFSPFSSKSATPVGPENFFSFFLSFHHERRDIFIHDPLLAILPFISFFSSSPLFFSVCFLQACSFFSW